MARAWREPPKYIHQALEFSSVVFQFVRPGQVWVGGFRVQHSPHVLVVNPQRVGPDVVDGAVDVLQHEVCTGVRK